MVKQSDITKKIETNVRATFTYNIKTKIPYEFEPLLKTKLIPSNPSNGTFYMIPEKGLTTNAEDDYTLTVQYTGPANKLDTASDRIKNMIFHTLKRLEDLQTDIDALNNN